MFVTTLLTLGTLSMFRWIEARIPVLFYVQHSVRFPINRAVPESEYCEFVVAHGFKVSGVSYNISVAGGFAEYQMALSSRDPGAERRLARAIAQNENVLEFRLAPSGD